MQSDSIAALASALSKAQGAMTGALKDSSNPFYKTRYADLAAVLASCRQQLADNELCVVQCTDIIADKPVLITTLAHSSGEWIKSITPILARDESAQAQGSGITYARRYALAAIVGIAQIDDDGEAAVGRKQPAKEPANPQNWPQLRSQLQLGGAAAQLVAYCSSVALNGELLQLRLDPSQALLRTPALIEKVAQEVSRVLGKQVRVEIELSEPNSVVAQIGAARSLAELNTLFQALTKEERLSLLPAFTARKNELTGPTPPEAA